VRFPDRLLRLFCPLSSASATVSPQSVANCPRAQLKKSAITLFPRYSVCFLFLILAVNAFSQVPGASLGLPPHGTFTGGPDSINLGNLNIHIEIPIFSTAFRGKTSTTSTYSVAYDSSLYQIRSDTDGPMPTLILPADMSKPRTTMMDPVAIRQVPATCTNSTASRTSRPMVCSMISREPQPTTVVQTLQPLSRPAPGMAIP
jgi:hypothetical protein